MANRFDAATIAAAQKSKILGIRAGSEPHKFIGIWVVVVQGRVFVRSWEMTPNGWFHTIAREKRGIVQFPDGREIPIRAIVTRSEKLKAAVDAAYAAKYNTKASMKYVKGFSRGKRRDTTTELVPAAP